MNIKRVALYLNEYSGILAGAYAIALISYGYMVTTVIFTNHTLPNALVYPYPSFKTLSEGRWFADLIILLGGGSGVQLMQAAVAIAIVTINGIIFCSINDVRNRLDIFLIVVFISLHPVFFDYYSFTVDHITFAIGDTLALVGIIALDRIRLRSVSMLVSALFFTLSVASYQPKISLVAVLLIVWCILKISNGFCQEKIGVENKLHLACVSKVIFKAAAIFTLSVLLYYISVTVTTTTLVTGPRGNINELRAILSEIIRSYPETWDNFSVRVTYLPAMISCLPLLVILAGLAQYFWGLRHNLGIFVSVALLVMLFPIALQLTYVINSQAWTGVGRILSPHAFFLAFFLAQMLKNTYSRPIAIALLGIFIYFFFIVTSQGANHAAMKNIFDVGKINRIASRVEQIAPDLYQYPHSLIVFGAIKSPKLDRFQSLRPSPYQAHISSETFAPYRQVDILNFFFGQDILRHPTKQEILDAIKSSSKRHPWPAPDSVFLNGDVIVVLLELPGKNVSTTWPRD